MTIVYEQGFFEPEHDGVRPFRWMTNTARISCPRLAEGEQIIFEAASPGGFPIEMTVRGSRAVTATLSCGWQFLCFSWDELQPEDGNIFLECDQVLDVPGDSRALSLMIGDICIDRPDDYVRNSGLSSKELLKRDVLESMPLFNTLEVSAKCNLRCAMCITDKDLGIFVNRGPKSFDTVKPWIEQLVPYTVKIQWHTSGEVFVGPHLWEAMELSKRHTHDHTHLQEIFTNGQLLDAPTRKRILDSPLNSIIFSTDAATERTYSRLRGGDFRNLCDSIRSLSDEDTEKRIHLQMSMILMRENIEELPDIIRLANDLGVRTVIYTPMFSFGQKLPVRTLPDGFTFYYRQQFMSHYPALAQRTIREALDVAREYGVHLADTPCFIKDYSMFGNTDLDYPLSPEDFDKALHARTGGRDLVELNLAKPERVKQCTFPWLNAFINQDGTFSPCHFMMYSGGFDSIKGKTFQEVWNSPEMQELRRCVRNGEHHPRCMEAQCSYITNLI